MEMCLCKELLSLFAKLVLCSIVKPVKTRAVALLDEARFRVQPMLDMPPLGVGKSIQS